jgi:ribosomal protein S12 methylthiotransferase accessory factor
MAKAIGEAVERYCAAIFDPIELPFFSFNSAPSLTVSPEKFALYRFQQYEEVGFPYRPFLPESPIHWALGNDLVSGQPYLVPASMVFVPYFPSHEDGEVPICQPISTGLACHFSQAEASLSAICEVVERDAFTIAWQARLAMPQILIESLSEQNQDLVNRYERAGAEVSVINLTMDHGIPTILSVLRHTHPELPALVFAAATHPDPEKAVRKSLEELALTRRLAKYLKQTIPLFSPGPDYENVVNKTGHVRLFCDQRSAHLADFIFASTIKINFDEIENLSSGTAERDVAVLVEKLGKLSYQVVIIDLTTPDVRGLGLFVHRAIIPGFHSLFFGHRIRALGGARLWEVPPKLGYNGIKKKDGDNPIPHPYP